MKQNKSFNFFSHPYRSSEIFKYAAKNSLVKLHIFWIEKSLTHDQKKHHGREHFMNTHLVNIFKSALYFINI